jgi:hypothetical protein
MDPARTWHTLDLVRLAHGNLWKKSTSSARQMEVIFGIDIRLHG